MSEWTLPEHDSTTQITPEQKDRVRRAAASWVWGKLEDWNESREELADLLGMLGLLPDQEEKLSHRLKLNSCDPVGPPLKGSKTGNRRRA